jgi:glyoxylase-like metal-dependent hydrolase (beta-lactamase superfamily II)
VKLHIIESGLLWLDGGPMFGIVPKALWERRIPSDTGNRIPLAMRALLVETPDELVLIETGLGNKESERFRKIYGVDNAPPENLPGADRLQAGLHALGFSPDDVTVVVDTHLHFDHAGGNTFLDAEGRLQLSFPRARYFVQKGEWEYAHDTNERTSASYLPHNYDPVMNAGQFNLLAGAGAVVPGVEVFLTPGHTPFHQSVLVGTADARACYMGDVVPTMTHLPLPWIMGYDVEPLRTLESKRLLLERAVAERWLLISTHDAVVPWGFAEKHGRDVTVAEVDGVTEIRAPFTSGPEDG